MELVPVLFVFMAICGVGRSAPQSPSLGLGKFGAAECRAGCLVKFQDWYPGGCEGGECLACWKMCGLLDSGRNATMCTENICPEGCQTACNFHLNQNRNSRPPIKHSSKGNLEFYSPLHLQGCSLSWGPVVLSSNSLPSSHIGSIGPFVYVVMRRDGAGAWHEVLQTVRTKASMDLPVLQNTSETRLVAVGVGGEVLEESLVLSRKFSTCITGRNYRQGRLRTQSPKSSHTMSTWVPVLEKVESDGFLAKATVSWPDQGKVLAEVGARFLVRWEAAEGSLITGSILTNSTNVILSLYKDQQVRVHVQLLGSNLLSADITIDTSTRKNVFTNSPVLSIAAAAGLLALVCLVPAFYKTFLKKHDNKSASENNKMVISTTYHQMNKSVNIISNPFLIMPMSMSGIDVRDIDEHLKSQIVNV